MDVIQKQFGGALVGVPKGWLDNTIVNFLGPPANNFRPNVVVTCRPLPALKMPGKTNLENFAALQRKTVEDSGLRDLAIIDESAVNLGTRTLKCLRFGWTNDVTDDTGNRFQHELRQDQYFDVVGDQAMTITFTCRAESYEDKKTMFDAILQATRFAD